MQGDPKEIKTTRRPFQKSPSEKTSELTGSLPKARLPVPTLLESCTKRTAIKAPPSGKCPTLPVVHSSLSASQRAHTKRQSSNPGKLRLELEPQRRIHSLPSPRLGWRLPGLLTVGLPRTRQLIDACPALAGSKGLRKSLCQSRSPVESPLPQGVRTLAFLFPSARRMEARFPPGHRWTSVPSFAAAPLTSRVRGPLGRSRGSPEPSELMPAARGHGPGSPAPPRTQVWVSLAPADFAQQPLRVARAPVVARRQAVAPADSTHPFLRIFLASPLSPSSWRPHASRVPPPRPPGLTAGAAPPPVLRAPRRSWDALPREGSLQRPPAAPAPLPPAPPPARAAPALGTYLWDKVTRLVRPGGHQRVSRASKRAGAGPCSARLCSSAPRLSPPLPSPPLPSAPLRAAPLPTLLAALRSPPAPPAAPRVLESLAWGSGGSPGGWELGSCGNGAEPGPLTPGKGRGARRLPRRAPSRLVGRGGSRERLSACRAWRRACWRRRPPALGEDGS